jgi:hypothetical protein
MRVKNGRPHLPFTLSEGEDGRSVVRREAAAPSSEGGEPPREEMVEAEGAGRKGRERWGGGRPSSANSAGRL